MAGKYCIFTAFFEITHPKEKDQIPPIIQLHQCLVDFIINEFSNEYNVQNNQGGGIACRLKDFLSYVLKQNYLLQVISS